MGELIPNWLLQRSYLTPNRTALVFNGQTWTFQELKDTVHNLAMKVAGYSVTQHSRVAILVKNRPSTVFLIHALQMIGAEIVFLNSRLTASELSYQIKDSETTVLFYDHDFDSSVKDLEKLCSQLKTCSIENLTMSEKYSVNIRNEFNLDEICSIMYTSGTTGKPKGVLQTYGNHWWSSTGSSLNLGLQANDAWLCTVPIFHISGLSILMRSVIYGIPVFLMEEFNEKQANSLLQSGKITIMSVVTVILNRMLTVLKDETYHENFRCMLIGGGPAPLPLLEKCALKKIPVFQTYGMTETSSQIVTLSPEDSFVKLGSAGKPLFPAQIKIVRTDGTEANARETGEISLKGPNITPGYLNRKQSFHDGWFLTGDLGYLDEDGFLYVQDRRSDLIISGGENVYPAEIEAVLMAHDAVDEAGVTGISDSTWGQVAYAFIVGQNVSEEELLQFCQARLASYKIPKRIIQVKELPRNASNKLVRDKLRLLIEGRE
ncbi:o-succinylbenzoate--CoA ligase [Lederbergia wuyishanensis]|uniref:2-succinylbenzoate--CoA ligase n=1 Tax=Lederbergia wuyishanensis TaxID=1347903 RepID=A0ABU0D4S3_9BACI|nr:o-succinylbenzoate--CoA ligase [Lederbergia wuyishanensis]MCJ8009502.1 o-succinylbenzoate--CoA ligase [Lederbergia wuyishanensis]MDQ0343407.1 O-succinylbenzoic acid--CoA ligase [Lederbergia wuyishanensis]